MSFGELGTSPLGSESLGGDVIKQRESKRNGTGSNGIEYALSQMTEDFEHIDIIIVGSNRLGINLS